MSDSLYKFRHAPGRAELWLAGTIGDDRLTSAQLRADLAKCCDDDLSAINVALHSFGGCYRESRKIHSVLRGAASQGARIIVNVTGAAASGGALIALSGDEIRIAANAYMMIHLPHMAEGQNAADQRRRDALISNAAERMSALIQRRTGLPESVVFEMMAEEVWFDSNEALNAGLADEIIDPTELADNIRHEIPHTPGTLAARFGIWHGMRNENRKRIRRDGGAEHMQRTALNINRRHWRTS